MGALKERDNLIDHAMKDVAHWKEEANLIKKNACDIYMKKRGLSIGGNVMYWGLLCTIESVSMGTANNLPAMFFHVNPEEGGVLFVSADEVTK